MYAMFSVCYNTEYFMITYVEVITQNFLILLTVFFFERIHKPIIVSNIPNFIR